MKIEDLKVGTKLKVIKTYRGNGIILRQGEIIKIKEVLESVCSVTTPYYYAPIVVPYDVLLDCCKKAEFIKDNKNDKVINWYNTKDHKFDKLAFGMNLTDILKSYGIYDQLNNNKISSTQSNKEYKVEAILTFKGKKYTIGDFIRIEINNKENRYGKINHIDSTRIGLTKLSTGDQHFIDLNTIIDMENIG
ncbi:hypothetical protein FKF97_10660 [Clostridium perfringens]|nr:hypothetical protein [Clostridium perfringens]